MDPLSITVSVSSLIVVCARVIRLSTELCDTYKSASFMLSAITAECSVISASLTRLQNMLLSQPSKTNALTDSLETALLGCALTMSVLYEQIGGLVDETKDGEMKPKKFKFVLEHDHLIEMLQQIRGQQVSITLMLQTMQNESLNEVKQSIQDYNIVLQQMVKKGRSMWQANHQSAPNPPQKTVASISEVDSVFELSSIITDTRFDFDDQVLDSKAYRRALANLKSAQDTRDTTTKGGNQVEHFPLSEHADGEDLDEPASVAIVQEDRFIQDVEEPMSGAVDQTELPLRLTAPEIVDGSQQVEQVPSGEGSFPVAAYRESTDVTKPRSADSPADLYLKTRQSHDGLREQDERQQAARHSDSEADFAPIAPESSARDDEPRRESSPILSSEDQVGLSASMQQVRDTISTEITDQGAWTEQLDISNSTQQSNETISEEPSTKSPQSSSEVKDPKTVARSDSQPRWHRFKSALFGPPKIPAPRYYRQLKLVVVGDGACGKTSLAMRLVKGVMCYDNIGTIFDNYLAIIEVDGNTHELGLFDTSGREDYDRLRPLSYPETDVVLICFSLSSAVSAENIQEKWISEVLHFMPGVPYFLVGCKKDVREDRSRDPDWTNARNKPVSTEQGEDLRVRIGARQYLECSADTGEGVKEVFDTAARAAHQHRIRQGRKKKNV